MWQLAHDPLSTKNLAFRLKLFEIFCLPTIVNQTEQNFKWVIILDKDLPVKFRSCLNILIRNVKNVNVHIYDPELGLEENRWFQPFLSSNCKYLLTTNFDDDDVMPVDFIESIHKHISKLAKADILPPVKIFATTNVKQWDLVTSRKTPMGILCNKHKTPSNIGFSLLAKYPDFQLNVLAIRHTLANIYFDTSIQRVTKKLFYTREAFGLNKDNSLFSKWHTSELYYDLGNILSPVLLVNHNKNVQRWRLFKQKEGCQKVIPENFFSNTVVNFEKLQTYSHSFNKTKVICLFLRTLFSMKYMLNKSGGRPKSVKHFFSTFKWNILR